MIINNAYSSNPYASIQNVNRLQSIQSTDTTSTETSANNNTPPTEPVEQIAPVSEGTQAVEVNLTQEGLQQSLGADQQQPAQTTPPENTSYGPSLAQTARQAVESGQIINISG